LRRCSKGHLVDYDGRDGQMVVQQCSRGFIWQQRTVIRTRQLR
jgi:hypothetical protein